MNDQELSDFRERLEKIAINNFTSKGIKVDEELEEKIKRQVAKDVAFVASLVK
jgi:hypothetical protein